MCVIKDTKCDRCGINHGRVIQFCDEKEEGKKCPNQGKATAIIMLCPTCEEVVKDKNKNKNVSDYPINNRDRITSINRFDNTTSSRGGSRRSTTSSITGSGGSARSNTSSIWEPRPSRTISSKQYAKLSKTQAMLFEAFGFIR